MMNDYRIRHSEYNEESASKIHEIKSDADSSGKALGMTLTVTVSNRKGII